MTDILSLVFRTFSSQTEEREELPAGPPPPAACSALLVGDAAASRSVLLLAALTAAAPPLDGRVVFFTRTQIQSLPPGLQQRVPRLSPESLKKIKFSYPRTVEELLQQVASLHEPANTSPTPPSLLVVDGLEGYLRGGPGGLDPAERARAALLSALLLDSAAFLSGLPRPSGPGPCRVLASFRSAVDAAAAEDPVLDVLDRYFRARCTLDLSGGYEAAAAGLREVWDVYLSGTGDREDRPTATRERKLLISPDGFMEFKVL